MTVGLSPFCERSERFLFLVTFCYNLVVVFGLGVLYSVFAVPNLKEIVYVYEG